MAVAIFYTHQTSGTCAGMCMCDHTHQMDKKGVVFKIYFLYHNLILCCENNYKKQAQMFYQNHSIML